MQTDRKLKCIYIDELSQINLFSLEVENSELKIALSQEFGIHTPYGKSNYLDLVNLGSIVSFRKYEQTSSCEKQIKIIDDAHTA